VVLFESSPVQWVDKDRTPLSELHEFWACPTKLS
jgi:hypothetical protein